MIHKVVAECWLGDCQDDMEVDHIDRNSHNNDYHNLRYVTKSQQMKNRDHSGISECGKRNLEKARRDRMQPIVITSKSGTIEFESTSECARFFSKKYNEDFEKMRYRLRTKKKRIYDYQISYPDKAA